MMHRVFVSGAAATAAALVGVSVASAVITIPTVPIGNPGNAADFTGYGSVAYSYRIGTTEVTNSQYAAFLNAVAATDTNNLYNAGMAGSVGGITRSGSSGSYTYAAVSGRENNPVNWLSFWSAARFANWMHNNQPTGPQNNSTTESGAYTITAGGISANNIARNPGWRWAVANENEWYKAAYFQPVGQGGDADSYWSYPTSSNTAPTTAQANFNNAVGNTRAVGFYASNFYGTFDMGGNLFEWNEAIVAATTRGVRGGGWSFGAVSQLRSDSRFNGVATQGDSVTGFRLVTIPAPTPCNLADFDHGGSVSVTDLFGFLDAWFAQFGQSGSGLAADFDGSGSVAVSDLFGYLDTWFEYFGTAC